MTVTVMVTVMVIGMMLLRRFQMPSQRGVSKRTGNACRGRRGVQTRAALKRRHAEGPAGRLPPGVWVRPRQVGEGLPVMRVTPPVSRTCPELPVGRRVTRQCGGRRRGPFPVRGQVQWVGTRDSPHLVATCCARFPGGRWAGSPVSTPVLRGARRGSERHGALRSDEAPLGVSPCLRGAAGEGVGRGRCCGFDARRGLASPL